MSVSVQAFDGDGKPISSWTTKENGEHIRDRAFTITEGEDFPLSSAITQAVGAASMCWDNVEWAGVFDDRRARHISAALEEFIYDRMAKREKRLHELLDNERARLAACLMAAEGQNSQLDGIYEVPTHPAWSPALSTIRTKMAQLEALRGGKAYAELQKLDAWLKEAFPRLETQGPDDALDSVRRAIEVFTTIGIYADVLKRISSSAVQAINQALEKLGLPVLNANVHKPD